MQILNLIQGSPEWHQVRLNHFTASESPAMMGASKYTTRDALLKLKATGIVPEVTDAQQRLFNKGHAAESAALPIAEAIIRDALYPVTGSIELDGLKLLASFDGLTADDAIGFEHKLWNEKLAASIQQENIDPHYFWQLEHQLLVSSAEKIIFATSDGSSENFISMIYYSKPSRRQQLIEGWKQFAKDLAAYVVPEAEAPKTIAEPVETLPAITYETTMHSTGLGLKSNLDAYKAAAQRLVEQSKKQLETDQDFANAEARTKQCKEAEKRISVIQSNVIGEVADIDKFVKDLGAISEMLRQCRLNEEKQITKRKDDIRIAAIQSAQQKLAAEISVYNCDLMKAAQIRMPEIKADFAGAIRGLKTVASLKSKLNDELARASAEANRTVNYIWGTLNYIQEEAAERMFLFPDLQQLVLRDEDALSAIVKQRLAEHEVIETQRLVDELNYIADQRMAEHEEELAKAQDAALEGQYTPAAPVREDQSHISQQTPMDIQTIPAAHAPHLTFSKMATTTVTQAANTEDFTKVDAALDKVLRASGSALRNYTMPATLQKMRAAMAEIMEAEYLAGSISGHNALVKQG